MCPLLIKMYLYLTMITETFNLNIKFNVNTNGYILDCCTKQVPFPAAEYLMLNVEFSFRFAHLGWSF